MEALKLAARAERDIVLQWTNRPRSYSNLLMSLLAQTVMDWEDVKSLVDAVKVKPGPELLQQQQLQGCDRLVSYLEGLMPDLYVNALLNVDWNSVDWEAGFFTGCDVTSRSHLLSKLDGYAAQWDGGFLWQAPFTAVVQSSGWGKSRSICDLRKHGVFVVYCSFMTPEYSGFPRRSAVAACFDAEITEQGVCAYLKACLQVLTGSDLSPEQWLECQIRLNKESRVGEAILERYKALLPEMQSMEKQDLQNALLQQVQVLRKEKSSLREGGNLQVLFAFDEGKGLRDFSSTFPVFRKAMSHLPIRCGLFVVFADTNASVANFTPHRGLDSVRKHGQKLFDPIHLIGKADLFVPGASGSRDAVVARDALVARRQFMHGRPLWSVHFFRSKLKDEDARLNELVRFASWKLLGGKNVVPLEGLSKVDAAAVFMACIGPEVLSRSYLAQDLVAGHMATCVATADERQRVLMLATSEAVLGEAAAFIFHRLGFLVGALKFLAELVTEGLMLEGARGELVTRMLLLLCMHECANSAGMPFYTGCVTLRKFLETMFGEDWKAANCTSGHLDAVVCFNHFVPVCRGVKITKQRLWSFLTHGAAILYPRGEFASDIGIPWAKFDAKDNLVDVGIFEVQVKNLVRLTGGQTSTAWNKLKVRQEREFSGQDPLVILNMGGDDSNSCFRYFTRNVSFSG